MSYNTIPASNFYTPDSDAATPRSQASSHRTDNPGSAADQVELSHPQREHDSTLLHTPTGGLTLGAELDLQMNSHKKRERSQLVLGRNNIHDSIPSREECQAMQQQKHNQQESSKQQPSFTMHRALMSPTFQPSTSQYQSPGQGFGSYKTVQNPRSSTLSQSQLNGPRNSRSDPLNFQAVHPGSRQLAQSAGGGDRQRSEQHGERGGGEWGRHSERGVSERVGGERGSSERVGGERGGGERGGERGGKRAGEQGGERGGDRGVERRGDRGGEWGGEQGDGRIGEWGGDIDLFSEQRSGSLQDLSGEGSALNLLKILSKGKDHRLELLISHHKLDDLETAFARSVRGQHHVRTPQLNEVTAELMLNNMDEDGKYSILRISKLERREVAHFLLGG